MNKLAIGALWNEGPSYGGGMDRREIPASSLRFRPGIAVVLWFVSCTTLAAIYGGTQTASQAHAPGNAASANQTTHIVEIAPGEAELLPPVFAQTVGLQADGLRTEAD